ncbi:hypothetical protein [Actinoplanes derwentensis]|nr:hypothetical protein [Actinoplanes derwentensis]
MRIWTDFSSIAKIAAMCALLGFVLGLFVACSAMPEQAVPGDQSRPAASSGSG